MLGDVVGYAVISRAADITSAAPASDFQGQLLRVLEFGHDNSVLVINNQASAIAMIEPKDILRSFKCNVIQNLVVCEPGLSFLDQMMYFNKCINRKGGYNHIVQKMVIAASIHSGKFNDSILWSLQE